MIPHSMAQGNRMGALYAGMEIVLSPVTTHLTNCLSSNMTIALVSLSRNSIVGDFPHEKFDLFRLI
jgi:hypothetical protein